MSKNELEIKDEAIALNSMDIKSMIYEIRGQKVMLDSDLAKLYGYTVKAFNQQVKNNIERFPDDFMFRLSREEYDEFLRSKIFTSKTNGKTRGGRTYLPCVFTEQGIYALSGILKGPLATAVSISLIRTFKQLKDIYIQNNYLLDRIINNEVKLIEFQSNTNSIIAEYGDKFKQIFAYIDGHKTVTEKIFYKGQIYDSYMLFTELISKAYKEIILIDNYVDNRTLNVLSKKNNGVNILLCTSNKGNKLTNEDVDVFNEQYPMLTIKIINSFHDRFLILDNKTIYLIGASFKDAGKKCFGITEMDYSNIKRIRQELCIL